MIRYILKSNINPWYATLSILGAAVVSLTQLQPTLAAEKITFTYGLVSQSVSLEELEIFATTGEVSSALSFLLKFSGQNPSLVRWILTQKFPTNTVIMSKLLNDLPGEYILKQSTSVIHSQSPKGDVQALRGALINSSSNDRQISLLELWHNYPTKQVYIDGNFLNLLSFFRNKK